MVISRNCIQDRGYVERTPLITWHQQQKQQQQKQQQQQQQQQHSLITSTT